MYPRINKDDLIRVADLPELGKVWDVRDLDSQVQTLAKRIKEAMPKIERKTDRVNGAKREDGAERKPS